MALELDPEMLRELHRILRQRTDLLERIDRGPRQLSITTARLKQVEADLQGAKEQQKKTRMLVDQKQLLLKEREGKIIKYRNQMNTCETNKEFQSWKEQIAAEEKANEVLSDEIFELLERLDVEAENIQSAQEKVAIADEENQTIDQRVAAEKATLEAELDRVNANLAEAEKKLPMVFRAEYNRLVKARGEEALAQVVDECCGSCYQTLSPQVFNELYMSKPVFCSSCGSVLYLSENRKVR